MKQEKEMKVVAIMIERYCHDKHNTEKKQLCPDCAELLDYAKLRREKCPFGDEKPFCANCKVHCYKPVMRQKIRDVMRYSGPKIALRHPIMTISHLVESKRQKKKQRQENK